MVLHRPGFFWHPDEAGRQSSPWGYMLAIAEAVSLGEYFQIDRNLLLDVLSKTTVNTSSVWRQT
jgi:hypothetical protein